MACADLGRREEALGRFSECLDRRRKVLGANHISTLQTEHQVAAVLFSLGLYEESRKRSEAILSRLETSLAGDHSFRGNVLVNLGKCLTATGKYPEAERALREGQAILLKKLGPGHRSCREAVKALEELLERKTRTQTEGKRPVVPSLGGGRPGPVPRNPPGARYPRRPDRSPPVVTGRVPDALTTFLRSRAEVEGFPT